MKVHKYVIDPYDQPTRLPIGRAGRPLHFDWQGEGLKMWALVDPEQTDERAFMVIGTGWEVPGDAILGYVGSCLVGSLVWHLLEVQP